MMKSLKSWALLSLVILPLSAHAGDLENIEAGIKAGVEACGLSLVSGQDPRLDYTIRARNVDQVVVNPAGVPGVLIDRQILNNALTLTYSRTNGGLIFQVSQDYDFNNVQIMTSRQGVVAYTNSYWRGQNLVRDYLVKLPNQGTQYVSQDQFESYLGTQIVQGFVDFVCGRTQNPL
jgi:hypothetical protein